jgi:hypothetical protein
LVPGKPNQIQQDSKFCHISGSNSKTQSWYCLALKKHS